MQFFVTSLIVVGIGMIILGVLQVFFADFRLGMEKRYTEESLDAFTKKNLIATTMFGVGCIIEALNLGTDNIFTLLAMTLIILGAALTFWFMTGLVRKSDAKQAKGKKAKQAKQTKQSGKKRK